MLSKEGASELRNLQSQGVKASFPGLGLGMLFSGTGASCSGVFVTCHPSKRHTHQLQQVSLGWFCPDHGARRKSETGNKQGRKAGTWGLG